MLGRLTAGLHLGAIILIWLVAWIPLALYCGIAIAARSLSRPSQV